MINLHSNNTRYNKILSKNFQTKNQYKAIRADANAFCKAVINMTRGEVVSKLKEMGITITERTLFNYAEWGLVPEPKKGGAGRGKGRTADYPDETPAEAYASWYLLHGPARYKPEHIAEIRSAVVELVEILRQNEDYKYDSRSQNDIFRHKGSAEWLIIKCLMENDQVELLNRFIEENNNPKLIKGPALLFGFRGRTLNIYLSRGEEDKHRINWC